MRSYAFIYIILLFAVTMSGCAWIDDIGTVDKKGSYTFTPTIEASEDASDVTNDALKCANRYDSMDFDVFDVNGLDDGIYQIIMLDQVRNRMNATQLSIDFVPRALNAPDTPCPTPDEILNTPTETSPTGCVRVKLALGDCSPRQTLIVTGTLTLTDFSTERRETVRGELNGKLNRVQYVETTDETTASVTELGQFSAAFQFPVHVGSPWMR